MASSVPYAAPYARTAAPARPPLRINAPLARFLTLLMAGALFYVLVQLTLASIASGMLQASVDLDVANAIAQRERDALDGAGRSVQIPGIHRNQGPREGLWATDQHRV